MTDCVAMESAYHIMLSCDAMNMCYEHHYMEMTHHGLLSKLVMDMILMKTD